MKNYIIIILSLITITACKQAKQTENTNGTVVVNGVEKTTKQADGLTLIKGDFIFFNGAAVLQATNNVYGIIVNDKMHELNKKVSRFKTEETDMIPVEIRGKIIPKPKNEDGWPFRIEIKEILNVSAPNPKKNDVIKLGS